METVKSLFVISLFPFYSSLVAGYIVAEYQLIYLTFFDLSFTSHRTAWGPHRTALDWSGQDSGAAIPVGAGTRRESVRSFAIDCGRGPMLRLSEAKILAKVR